MSFESILFPEGSLAPTARDAPACFRDLNLDQVVSAITRPFPDYDLVPFFHAPLEDLEAIRYRQDVVRDLSEPGALEEIRAFAAGFRSVRVFLDRSAKFDCREERERWFVTAFRTYAATVETLSRALAARECHSRALADLALYLRDQFGAPVFQARVKEAQDVETALAAIRYAVFLRGSRVTVRPYTGQADYAGEVEATFERFRRAAVGDYRVNFTGGGSLNHVEAQILERVTRLYPEPFAALAAFRERHADFVDPVLLRFDREVHVYVAYLAHAGSLADAGLPFCVPEVSRSKDVEVEAAFDLALAGRLVHEKVPVVTNDLSLTGPERVVVVSGPNQGGKTTYARMFGQLHYLARLGLPVPGRAARLFLCDRVFTHFEKQENIQDLRGKLQDDLVRIKTMLDQATPASVLVLNEIFSSTTLEDAVFLSRRVMERLFALDALAVWVTFLDELSRVSERTTSVVSTVDPADPAVRTFRLERRPADGLAHALAIAEKHRVTAAWLARRLAR